MVAPLGRATVYWALAEAFHFGTYAASPLGVVPLYGAPWKVVVLASKFVMPACAVTSSAPIGRNSSSSSPPLILAGALTYAVSGTTTGPTQGLGGVPDRTHSMPA